MSQRSSLSMHVLSLAMPFKRRYIIDFGVKPSTRIHMRVWVNVWKTSPHHSKRTTLWPNNLLKAGSSPQNLEILLLLLGVLFLVVILVFLLRFLLILGHFDLLQGSIWIHTKLLGHELVHMAHQR